ncbi:MAG: hypothetical protein AAF645_18140 [Myxococcota bacterium]
MSEPPPPREGRVLALFAVLALALLVVGGLGARSIYQRFAMDEPAEVAEAVIPVEATVDPADPPPPPPPPPMAPRYRPGPYVQTVGLLPGGLSTLRRMASARRGGHQLNNPWIVAGGELRPGAGPGPSGGPALALQGADPQVVVPRTAATLDLRTDLNSQGLLLVFEGYEGHFFVPAQAQTELGRIAVAGDLAQLQFGIDAPTLPSGAPATSGQDMRATVRVAAVDAQGRVSPFQTRQLRVPPVGTGDVEVALSMTRATDLDLYVVEPTGTVISYSNTRAGSGGHLDLDANAACGSNVGVNAEHVYWPQGQAPAGTYQVRVAHYTSCIGGAPVDYRITVRNCGETAVFSGRFTGEGDSGSCLSDPGARSNWCQQVVSFDVTPCNNP